MEGVYTNTNFTKETHIRLMGTVRNVKGNFILSYNDCEEISELYKNFAIILIQILNNLSQKYEAGAVYNELTILNHDSTRETKQMQLSMLCRKRA